MVEISCTFCNIIFNKKPSEINDINFCCREHYNLYRKTLDIDIKKINMFAKRRYAYIKYRCNNFEKRSKTYIDRDYNFTKNEFKNFCFLNKNLILTLKQPSIDRIDNLKGYLLDNLQIIEMSENIGKDKRKSKNNKCICYKCNIEKDLIMFSKSKRSWNGYSTICKKCDNLRKKK